MRNPFVRRHPFGEEELSAYLDGRLSPAESARLERHLTSCGPCRRHMKELRAVVESLRALPSIPAPRSFALRPEQVEAPQRRRPAGAAWLPRTSAFGPAGAAVVSLVVLLVLVGVDLGTLGGGGAPAAALPSSVEKVYEPDQALSEAPPTTSPGKAQGYEAPPMQAPAPAPTPAPVPPPLTGEGEREAAGTPQALAGATTPTETPAAMAAAPPPAATAEEGGGSDRWVLRGFQGLAGAAFLASVALLWRRRRAGHV